MASRLLEARFEQLSVNDENEQPGQVRAGKVCVRIYTTEYTLKLQFRDIPLP